MRRIRRSRKDIGSVSAGASGIRAEIRRPTDNNSSP